MQLVPTEASHSAVVALHELAAEVRGDFLARFGRPASIVVAAPGRVNLIGEHIDYNDGYVLPLAVERYVVIAAAPRSQPTADSITMHSLELDRSETVSLTEPIGPGRGWISYLEGVIALFSQRVAAIPPLDAVIGSNLPVGAGLSSSAALEVACATLLEQVTGRQLTRRDKALLCQQAEHQFAGVPCGIMDQFSSVYGQAGQLLKIDCQHQKVQPVPLTDPGIALLITNSHVRHELSGGEYAARRAECDAALAKLHKPSWRGVAVAELQQRREALSDAEFRRGRHVVTEIARTVAAAAAIRDSDWPTVGELMYASHASLQHDYQVSCPELDLLVAIAEQIGIAGGVVGSRMTGGGFGGCTVSLVQTDCLDAICSELCRRYQAETNRKAECFATRPARGAHVISHQFSQ